MISQVYWCAGVVDALASDVPTQAMPAYLEQNRSQLRDMAALACDRLDAACGAGLEWSPPAPAFPTAFDSRMVAGATTGSGRKMFHRPAMNTMNSSQRSAERCLRPSSRVLS